VSIVWAHAAVLCGLPCAAHAAGDPRYYDIGTPVLQDIWVDPIAGDDANTGSTRGQALRTVTEAWQRVPMAVPPPTGYRIMLVSGTYEPGSVPGYWESRYGTYQYPVVVQAADGPGSAVLPSMNIFDCRYFYLIGLTVQAAGGDVLHCERCDHFLVRQARVSGAEPETFNVQETLKVNQSQSVYVEDSDISGAWDNAVDFVAVQHGHVQGNHIHNAGDWCMYVKGGSASVRVEGNQFDDCGTGGFTAGQGTGFEFMETPWLHYEAYDVKFVNNFIHDTSGAGIGINGGYNILMAHNTLYRVGASSHVFEAVFGLRACDGNTAACSARLTAGGWGTTGSNEQPIPNRNVYVYNNILYNPPGFSSQWQQFAIYGPRTPAGGSNIPSPARTDTNLQIRGNIIWNGPATHPLGIEDAAQGCQPDNPTCNAAQLVGENHINAFEPQLVNPSAGDFHPVPGGNVFGATAFAIPDFQGGDQAQPPLAPAGDLSNQVARDYSGGARAGPSPPGAYGQDCAGSVCGDGALDAGCEQCDDGNLVDGDGCDSNCTPTGCGNAIVSAGEQCDDGNLVNGDGCDSNCTPTGCGNGVMTSGEQCDDGNAVSGDGCSATCGLDCAVVPWSGCRAPAVPGKGSIRLKDETPDDGDRLVWRWMAGAATAKAEFGNPVTSTGYQLCVYDELAGAPSLVLSATAPAGGTCDGRPCWSETTRGFAYRNPDLVPGGLFKVELKAGAAGRAKIVVKGRGGHLGMPSLPLRQDATITVQLRNSAGDCWAASYSAPASQNKDGSFHDRAD
jgi:cysteine-rich repeat protein